MTRQPLRFLERNQKKMEGDYAFTVDGGQTGGIRVRQPTKKGYEEANAGDSINLTQPNSKTRRGRVGKGVAQTLDTGVEQAVVVSGTPKYGKGKRTMQYKESDTVPTIRATQHKSGDNQAKIRVYDDYNQKVRKDGNAGTLTTNTGSKAARNGQKIIARNQRNEVRHMDKAGSLSAQPSSKQMQGVHGGDKIRRLTPVECERLQGFPDGWTDGQSDTQRYKQMGNAVTVNVIEAIAGKLAEVAT